MIKNIMFFQVLVFGLGFAAFADPTVYLCGLIADSDGHHIYGGPGYSLSVEEGRPVVLEERRMVMKNVSAVSTVYEPAIKKYPMERDKDHESSQFHMWKYKNVTASFFQNGEVRISVGVGAEDYSSSCTPAVPTKN